MRRLAPAALALAALACDPGPAPPAGTYAVELTGTRTVYLDSADPGTTSDHAISTSAVVYVDEGINGADLAFTFAAQGLPTPSDGRLFELRLFPNAFPDDVSSATLAGIFFDENVEAIGQASTGGNNVTVTFEGEETPTLCPIYQRYRLTYLLGTWAGTGWDVGLDAAYDETCRLNDGTLVRNRYPRVIYQMEGTLDLSFAPFEETTPAEVAP